MSGDLRVSLTLQLKNLLGRGLASIRGDLKGLKDEAKGLQSIKGPNADGLARYGQRAREASTALRQLKREQAAISGGGGQKGGGGGGNTLLATGGKIGLALGGIYAGRQAVRGTVGEAIGFEKAFAQVRKKVDTDEAGFKQLEQLANRTASSYGLARGAVAELLAEAGAAGIAFQDLERFMKLTAKAAVAWDMSAPEAAQKLAEIKSGTQMTIGQLETLGEKINGLGDNSAAKERDIIEMFARAGAAAKAAGVNFDVSLAALTAVRSTGLQPEIASRWFAAFTGGLATIDEGKKDAKEGLKELGLEAKKVSEGMKRDALGTILDLFNRLEKAPNQAAVARKIFGKEWWDETARATQALPEFRKQMEFLRSGKWGGSLDKTLGIELATTANKLERFKALASEIGGILGGWTLPPLNKGLEGIIDKVRELQDRLQASKKAPENLSPERQKFLQEANKRLEEDRKTKADRVDRWLVEPFFGKKLTKDPAREISGEASRQWEEAEVLSKKLTSEAAVLRAQEKNAKTKSDRARLAVEAGKKEAEALAVQEKAARAVRGAGPMAGRDMTNIEGGIQQLRSGKLTPTTQEQGAAAAKAEAEQLRGQIATLESRLTHGGTGGAFMTGAQRGAAAGRRAALEAELEQLKTKLREVEGQASQTGATVKDKLTMDMTGAGQQVGTTYAAGIAAGTQAAVAAAQGMAAAVRSTLSTPAAAPAGGAAPAPQKTGAAGGNPVVKVGGITINGAGNPEATARATERRLASAIQQGLAGAHHDGVT